MSEKNDAYLFVLDRGFVLVGRPRPQTPGNYEDYLFFTLDDCAVVRRWGTTKGIGQLAAEGPLSATVLDREPDGTLVNRLTIFRQIPCNAAKWDKWPK